MHRNIVMMSMLYRFPSVRKARLWAEACKVANCLMDPIDFDAKEMLIVKNINSVGDVQEAFEL